MKNENKTKKTKDPWPTKDAMNQVYEMKLWGGEGHDFYSGSGSHYPEIITPYINILRSFLNAFKSPLTVCDLGCGDFNIGKQLAVHTKKYVGVDIVKSLIERNREKFKERNLEFHCLDITIDKLPSGDCAILRQVLQHLSNAEVQRILHKLTAFKYVIVTEHLPEGDFEPNKDIISGQGTRLKKQSGLSLLEPPFNFRVKEEKKLAVVVLDAHRGIIVTTLYKIF